NIDNPQTPEIKINFITLIAECLDPFRINYGEPITVSSGFRNQEVSKAEKFNK
ncbi:hypothetical protein U3516DRAFT_574899, partial [Neocallimastix sp. 'constans']